MKKALPLTLSIVVWSFFTYLLLILRDGTHDLPTVIIGTFLGLVFAGSVTWGSIGTYCGWKRMRVSKFKIVILMALVAIFCGIAVTFIEIWKLNVQLSRLYWIAENTGSGMVGAVILSCQQRLQERIKLLTALTMSESIVACTLVLPSRIYTRRKTTSAVP